MYRKESKIKAQSFIEYSMLIILLAAAIVAMKTFLTRIVQDKYRQSADVYGEGEQYEPGVTVASNEQ